MRHFLLLCVYIFILSGVAFAQETTISAELRPRFEYRNGFRGLAEREGNGLFAVTQRSGVSFEHSREKLDLKVTLRDVRTWGETSTIQNGNNVTTVAEAWADIKMNSVWSVKVGRQPLKYMDGRILGTNNWNQMARFHDAVVVKMEDDNLFTLHAGGAISNDSDIDDNEDDFYSIVNTYKAMAFAYLKKDFNQFRGELTYLANGYQSSNDSNAIHFTHTGGIRLMKTKGVFKPEASFYYQGGVNRNGTDVRALMATVSATYQAGEKWSFQLGSDYVSGQDYNENSTVDHRFDLLYGFRHKYYGHMDYFYIGGNTNYGLGFSDTYFKADYKVNSKWNVYCTIHQFISGNTIEDESTMRKYSNNLGTELDFGFGYEIEDYLKIVGGYSQMFASESLGFLEGSPDFDKNNDWVWIQLNITPTLFTWKKEEVADL